MATFTGNVFDFTGHPRPGLHPQLVIEARQSALQSGAIFFPVPLTIDPEADGSFSFALINSYETAPFTIYDGRVEWVNGAGIPVGFDPLPGVLILTGAGGPIGDYIQTAPTAIDVHVGETDDPAYGFWYQPSTALLKR